MKFYSPGKLLISAEYFVLSGAEALALPTQMGQHMNVEPIKEPVLQWKSYDLNRNLWMEGFLSIKNFEILETQNTPLALFEKLQNSLRCTRILKPDFCKTGYKVSTQLDFDRNWGLGSSSTFINNLAQWAEINPFELLYKTFGGSGCDVAVAQTQKAILYSRNQKYPSIESINFNPPFTDQMYFVHLNQKQDSQKEVDAYNKRPKPKQKLIEQMSHLTKDLSSETSLSLFEELLKKHEELVGNLIGQQPIQERLFSDFDGRIKSLGAWGGDFILCTRKSSLTYFKERGYPTIIPYSKMIAS
ncbi:MAG: GYDIA family GHMP kinase [Flavobacteriaceae bacterium]